MKKTVEICATGRDSHGEPIATYYELPATWVIPVTELEHLRLSEALARNHDMPIPFEIDDALESLVEDIAERRREDDAWEMRRLRDEDGLTDAELWERFDYTPGQTYDLLSWADGVARRGR